MIKVEGKAGISARVVAYSKSAVSGILFPTYEIECPRIVLAEENTHRALSKNSASSRAIPFNKMKTQLTGRPVRFGEANPGMQDKGEDHDGLVEGRSFAMNGWGDVTPCFDAEEAWDKAKEDALFWSEAFFKAGYHKQVYNRLTEPFQMMKTVMSGTEWANFFWLRKHEAADPTLHELARVMYEAEQAATPFDINPGEWHLPYVERVRLADGRLIYGDFSDAGSFIEYTLEDAIKISCARCAAVSFRNVDYGLEKCREVYDRLVGDERKHASAFEHQATPMKAAKALRDDFFIPPSHWEFGVSHMDADYNLWSGNIKGFIQYRKTIPGENYTCKI